VISMEETISLASRSVCCPNKVCHSGPTAPARRSQVRAHAHGVISLEEN